MKNWKTTLSGILLGVGLLFSSSEDKQTKNIGVAAASIGAILQGAAGKDSNVTGGTKQQ